MIYRSLRFTHSHRSEHNLIFNFIFILKISRTNENERQKRRDFSRFPYCCNICDSHLDDFSWISPIRSTGYILGTNQNFQQTRVSLAAIIDAPTPSVLPLSPILHPIMKLHCLSRCHCHGTCADRFPNRLLVLLTLESSWLLNGCPSSLSNSAPFYCQCCSFQAAILIPFPSRCFPVSISFCGGAAAASAEKVNKNTWENPSPARRSQFGFSLRLVTFFACLPSVNNIVLLWFILFGDERNGRKRITIQGLKKRRAERWRTGQKTKQKTGRRFSSWRHPNRWTDWNWESSWSVSEHFLPRIRFPWMRNKWKRQRFFIYFLSCLKCWASSDPPPDLCLVSFLRNSV